MKSLSFSVLLAVAAAGSAFPASVCVNDPSCVLAGSDYFATTAGTFFTIAGVTVPLSGVPGSTGADTIVQRLSNIDVAETVGAMQVVNTQMTTLSLTGIDPNCPQGIGACDVFVNLDPVNPTLGSLDFTRTVVGAPTVNPTCGGDTTPCNGTFTSFFDVFFDLSFTTLGGAPLPCDANGDISGHACEQPDLTLTGSGSWTDGSGEFFIAGGKVMESHPSPPGVHDAQQISPTPEPGSLVLFGAGLSLAGLFRRRKG